MSIIAISGKMQSGKNTVASIIQYLTDIDTNTDSTSYQQYLETLTLVPTKWKQVAFAGKLKQIVSILTGIHVKDLEKQEVKNKVLGEEWWYFKVYSNIKQDEFELIPYKGEKGFYDRKENYKGHSLIKPTVRQILQLCGTEAVRNAIHPNCWVNALFADYIPYSVRGSQYEEIESKWIITDVRFPNELEAVKQRGGITIRVNRDLSCEVCKLTKYERRGKICNEIACPQGRKNYQGNHPSETALDNAEFDYTIDNSSTIEELIKKVKEILIKEKII